MRFFISFIFLLSLLNVEAQTKTETIKSVITEFFNGFHTQDSIKIKSYTYTNVSLKTITTNASGSSEIKEQDFSSFLKSIVSIPQSTQFKEQILDYRIEIDDNLATVWTPYNFMVNGQLSHCGANAFQLINTTKGWKIFSIVDTRHKKGCN